MIHNIMDLCGQKFMQDWHSHGSVGQGCQKSYSPTRGVATADGHFVAFFHSRRLEDDMQFLDDAGDVLILERLEAVITESVVVPIFLQALLYAGIKARNLGFHTS